MVQEDPPQTRLVVAISSRALFNLEEENAVFETGSIAAYRRLQRDRLDVPAAPGVALPLIRKLLAFKTELPAIDVAILSRNDPATGLRLFNSARHHGLDITRGVFT